MDEITKDRIARLRNGLIVVAGKGCITPGVQWGVCSNGACVPCFAAGILSQDNKIVEGAEAATAEVFFFGCYIKNNAGHNLRSKISKIDFNDIPWGFAIDGGLLCANEKRHRITHAFEQRDGWTILSFDDFQGDSRPGSNSAFFAHAILTPERLVELTRVQWPELADRIPANFKAKAE